MRLALCQTQSIPGALETNRAHTVDQVRRAQQLGAELIVLPELCTTGYLFRDREECLPQAEALTESASIEAWTEACRGRNSYLVAGLLEYAAGSCYNTAVLVGPEGLVGSYRKAHLFGPEKRWSEPGRSGFSVFEVHGVRVGLLICYDLRFPEAARTLTLRGAQLIAVPTTWTDIDKPNPFDDQGRPIANYLALAHAYTNRVFVACAARVGSEGGVRYLGSSLVVGPKGEWLAGPASHDREEILVANLLVSEADDKRVGGENDLIADRRVDLYEVD